MSISHPALNKEKALIQERYILSCPVHVTVVTSRWNVSGFPEMGRRELEQFPNIPFITPIRRLQPPIRMPRVY